MRNSSGCSPTQTKRWQFAAESRPLNSCLPIGLAAAATTVAVNSPTTISLAVLLVFPQNFAQLVTGELDLLPHCTCTQRFRFAFWVMLNLSSCSTYPWEECILLRTFYAAERSWNSCPFAAKNNSFFSLAYTFDEWDPYRKIFVFPPKESNNPSIMQYSWIDTNWSALDFWLIGHVQSRQGKQDKWACVYIRTWLLASFYFLNAH